LPALLLSALRMPSAVLCVRPGRLNFHTKCERFIERLVAKFPDSVPLRILNGHSCLVHMNYENAKEQYARAWIEAPQDPYINMFLGQSFAFTVSSPSLKVLIWCFFQGWPICTTRSTSTTVRHFSIALLSSCALSHALDRHHVVSIPMSVDRHYNIVQAFTFLFNYYGSVRLSLCSLVLSLRRPRVSLAS
jgi:hypothetical protein